MNSKLAAITGLAAILAAVIAVPSQAAFAATVNAEIVTNAQNLADKAFNPNPIQANVGDKVVWTNNDATLHTVTSGTATTPTKDFGFNPDGTPIYIPPKTTFGVTFDKAGDFNYFCSLHPTMVGMVKVAGAGGPQPVSQSSATAVQGSNSYPVTAASSTAKVLQATIDPAKSVTVKFDNSGDVELTLQKAMIDGISAVKAGTQDVSFQTVSSDARGTTIKFTVPAGSDSVSIMGSMVVPEFGVLAAIVLAASMVAVIGFARFKGNSLGF